MNCNAKTNGLREKDEGRSASALRRSSGRGHLLAELAADVSGVTLDLPEGCVKEDITRVAPPDSLDRMGGRLRMVGC
jgi:hypothetical protein